MEINWNPLVKGFFRGKPKLKTSGHILILRTTPESVGCSDPSCWSNININISDTSVYVPLKFSLRKVHLCHDSCITHWLWQISVSSCDSSFLCPQWAANGSLLSIKQRQTRAFHAVSHLPYERASNPLFIINNVRFLLGPDTGNVITMYCPRVVIS